VLLKLGEKTVLRHVIERVRAACSIDAIVIATTTGAHDSAIVTEVEDAGATAFRGSEADVLDRYFQAACQVRADWIVRITSDCPLYDPALLDEMLGRFDSLIESGEPIDYFSNTLDRSFPRGLDTEIFTFEALARAHREARALPEREHVTPYLYGHPELFHLRGYSSPLDLSGHRWTLDTPDDWRFISGVYEKLAGRENRYSRETVLRILRENPELLACNAHVEQKTI
jgi:spore coat polysaccharide biosynthesis protein SpsF